MQIILDTKELKLIQNLYDKATDLNCSSGDGEQEQDALECALIAMEDAGYTNGLFMPVNAHHDQSQPTIKAALELIDMVIAGKATDGKTELVDRLREYVEELSKCKIVAIRKHAQPDPLKPVISAAWDLIGMLIAEGSDNALDQQTGLIDALEQYEALKLKGGA